MASKRKFQLTKESNIQILYAKVTKGQNCFGRCSKIVSSTYVHIDFEDVHRVTMAVLGQGTILGVPTLKGITNISGFLCILHFFRIVL